MPIRSVHELQRVALAIRKVGDFQTQGGVPGNKANGLVHAAMLLFLNSFARRRLIHVFPLPLDRCRLLSSGGIDVKLGFYAPVSTIVCKSINFFSAQ